MDIYVSLALSVILGIIDNRRDAPKYYRQLSKVLWKLTHLLMTVPQFQDAYTKYVKEKAGE